MDDDNNDSSTDDDKECPICCDTIISNNNNNNAVVVVEMPCCKQQFCRKCLDGWRPGLDHYMNGNRTCPCCRALVPPTQDVLCTIGFYKEVSLSLRILMQDPFCANLPVPPFSNNLQHAGPFAIRHYYENMESVYGQRVRCFEQLYGAVSSMSTTTITSSMIPSTPPPPMHFPVSVVQAVRANDYFEVRRFFGFLPIPPRRLNAICPSYNGNTILHIAVQANNLDMVHVLLALGANPNATNFEHLTPLFYAVKIQGSDDRVAKTLIRYGAKKVSMIFPTTNSTSLNPMSADPLLAATAEVLGKSELARMLERAEAHGRHCKVLCNIYGMTRRGTIQHVTSDSYHVLLDGCSQETVIVATFANVEVCKPLLFDFRGIDRNALFPNDDYSSPPGQGNDNRTDPPGRYYRHLYSQSRASRFIAAHRGAQGGY